MQPPSFLRQDTDNQKTLSLNSHEVIVTGSFQEDTLVNGESNVSKNLMNKIKDVFNIVSPNYSNSTNTIENDHNDNTNSSLYNLHKNFDSIFNRISPNIKKMNNYNVNNNKTNPYKSSNKKALEILNSALHIDLPTNYSVNNTGKSFQSNNINYRNRSNYQEKTYIYGKNTFSTGKERQSSNKIIKRIFDNKI
jgi:hypothetical protein